MEETNEMTDIFIRKWLQMGPINVWRFQKELPKAAKAGCAFEAGERGYSWEVYEEMPSSGAYKDPYGNCLEDRDIYLCTRATSLTKVRLEWPLHQTGVPLWEIFGKLDLDNDRFLDFANTYGALSCSEYGPYVPTKPNFNSKEKASAATTRTWGIGEVVDTLAFWREQVLIFGALLEIEDLLTSSDKYGLRKLIKTPTEREAYSEIYEDTEFFFEDELGTRHFRPSSKNRVPFLVYERELFPMKRILGAEFYAQPVGMEPTIPCSAQVRPEQLDGISYDPIAMGRAFRNYLIREGLQRFPIEVGLCLENPEKPYPVLKPSCLLSALYFGYSLHIADDLKYGRCANCKQMGLEEEMTHRKDGTLLHKNETAAVHQRESRARKKTLKIFNGEPIRPRGRPKKNMIQ